MRTCRRPRPPRPSPRAHPPPPAPPAPPFRAVAPDRTHASALSFVPLAPTGDFATFPDPNSALTMDPTPDGVATIGGAHPTAIVATANGAYAYVAMTNVDRIATVALT